MLPIRHEDVEKVEAGLEGLKASDKSFASQLRTNFGRFPDLGPEKFVRASVALGCRVRVLGLGRGP